MPTSVAYVSFVRVLCCSLYAKRCVCCHVAVLLWCVVVCVSFSIAVPRPSLRPIVAVTRSSNSARQLTELIALSAWTSCGMS